MNIKVSVVVPVYNAEKYLAKSIESMLSQSLKEIELILVNDGSKDKSLAICEEYAKRDSRIIVINKRNEGACIARNTGISIAKGKYIAFLVIMTLSFSYPAWCLGGTGPSTCYWGTSMYNPPRQVGEHSYVSSSSLRERYNWIILLGRCFWASIYFHFFIIYFAMDLKLECCQHKSQRLKKAKQAQELQLQATWSMQCIQPAG